MQNQNIEINPAKYFDGKSNAIIFEYSFTVDVTDLDFLGHMNNANYMRYFERARWDFINKQGYGLEDAQKRQQSPILLETKIRFKRELRNREVVTIFSQSKSVVGKMMTLNQVMVKSDGKIAAEADFIIGYFDMTNRKLMTPTDEWLHVIGFPVMEKHREVNRDLD